MNGQYFLPGAWHLYLFIQICDTMKRTRGLHNIAQKHATLQFQQYLEATRSKPHLIMKGWL